ncbi:MAG: hypothetical protein A3C30_03630 [Candidatus Levybacteria bacterium RIFCSPHIGHO2_02_FULL_40_18]|nr:MAG: hypothetical protein A2869_00205 [Candidatus Levybacteria bacterium RIFCSPHIGHO2_01_FULL_40_58]OGH26176.1 MAG: hypothetical protein A3C30_03630 [Candidatus Levybacteria bacterium RIFCSPHIGHO2_02_FULL_40_18]OGH31370.1 MAG: hypothetical protein A3E43_03290 [Candidatus Levybacteria bacterium RIFCSPHIGHO2_12_FULL_40_31]OGH40059.1 MAG: hypothetical protein A2894_03945 [Candidatus Levybacteria bacterium RIFCSPLOWO2_01_FULL_40_64]OGH49023.1 MAG: hypothetical protein A3I54_00410 [Candidatus Lev
MTLNSEARAGNPPGPEEMTSSSLDVRVALSRASMIAMQRKDREIGIGHLLLGLCYDPDVSTFLQAHAFTANKGEELLKKVRGRNIFRRYSSTPPPKTAELRSLLDRVALNNLYFSSGEGKVTSFNLLHAIVSSNHDGVQRGRPRQDWQAVFVNEGVKVLQLAGVNLNELETDVAARVVNQYRPKTSETKT